ncbi:putative translation initiation inhibitor, yjgF family [Pseudomonas sp. GM84]|uniref:RidA family protein n=1 Tax=Pseudomonas sp. GM84 TaxID=1144340 RepID=UPI00026F4CCB|nr:RidA family protein [Pseudomonas sp. GM84]EJN39649.1 putative translation initiation inhibitor, yjgF family [Pseudomonas sp. GM84]
MQESDREKKFVQLAAEFELDLSEPPASGGLYAPAVIEDHVAYLSGQIPKIGDIVLFTGKVGDDLTLEQAKRASAICALRAVSVLKHTMGSLDAVRKVLRMNVYVQAGEGFAEHTQVADGASKIFHEIFGNAAGHARTAVGVPGLPRNAAVEVDIQVALLP